MSKERTLSIIKPDATKRNITGAINKIIEENNLKILAQKRIKLSNQYFEAIISFGNGDKEKAKKILNKIMIEKDKTYSPLALYFLIDNKLTLFSSNGYLKTIDPLNGKFLKSINFDPLGTEPIFIEDKLIILTSDGDLKVYK